MWKLVKGFRKYFIPHEGNDHKPHFFRAKAVMVSLVVLVGIEVLFLTQIFVVFDKTKLLGAVLPAVLTSLTNQDRAENDAPPLVESNLLDKAAQMKADDMATRGYFSHITPDGKDPWYFFALNSIS